VEEEDEDEEDDEQSEAQHRFDFHQPLPTATPINTITTIKRANARKLHAIWRFSSEVMAPGIIVGLMIFFLRTCSNS